LTTYEFEIFGGVKSFVNYRGPEAIIHGPAETGKTIGALYKLHICADQYEKASIVICRKTLTSAYSTVLQTFQNKVLRDDPRIQVYGGEKPQWFDYPSGSRIWMAGMDKSSKVLSAEHDLIYINQAEELTLDEWETLVTRTTGRAGHMPYNQTIGDANPAYSPRHWMYHRPSLKLFSSRHTDNPTLYDPKTGELTEQGKLTMSVLDSLTGARRTRLRDGKPGMAEGIIYNEYDESVHLIYRQDLPVCTRYFASQDWGYTNPGCLGLWGLDNDDRMYLISQVYQTHKRISWWVEQLKKMEAKVKPNKLLSVACDPSEPAYIEDYRRAGFNAVAAFNRVRPGIDAVEERLSIAGDGRPRLFIVRDSLAHLADPYLTLKHKPECVQDEFYGYTWQDTDKKEIPVKEDDHGMDMIRYGVVWKDGVGGKGRKKAGVWR
jgi:phage terminase large subunit